MKLERYLIDQRIFKTARDAKDLQCLGLGCLLHDVGKMRIPGSILHKPGRLTPQEMEVMKLHPVFGHEMVRGRVPAAASQVVLNHHQRYNGGGYPERVDNRTGAKLPPISGQQIPVFSRIATVCDVYDAATTTRVYSTAKLPVQALYEMRTACHGFFDPVVEQAFYQVIPPFPIGQVVTLTNGAEAVVVDFNSRHPYRPKVQGLRDPFGERYLDPSLEEIDLALHPEEQIAAIDGADVRHLQNLPPLRVPTGMLAAAGPDRGSRSQELHRGGRCSPRLDCSSRVKFFLRSALMRHVPAAEHPGSSPRRRLVDSCRAACQADHLPQSRSG